MKLEGIKQNLVSSIKLIAQDEAQQKMLIESVEHYFRIIELEAQSQHHISYLQGFDRCREVAGLKLEDAKKLFPLEQDWILPF